MKFKTVLIIFSLIVTAYMLLHRRPDALSHSQFWAEEGNVFVQQELLVGIKSFGIPFAGYLHLYPRTVCYLTLNLFSAFNWPFVFNVISFITFLLLVIFLFVRCKLPNITIVGLALLLTMLPVANEVFLNITNQQWSLALILLVIISYPSEKKGWFLFDIIAAAFVGLTGPFSIVFSPLALTRAYLSYRKKENLSTYLPSLIIVLAGIIQFLMLIGFPRGARKYTFVLSDFLVFFVKLFNKLHFQVSRNESLINMNSVFQIVFCFSILLLIHFYIIWLAYKRLREENNFDALCIYIGGMLVFIASMYSFEEDLSILHPLYAGVRYFYIPIITITWTAIILTSGRFLPTLFWIGFFLFIFIFRWTYIPVNSFKDKQWSKYASKIEQGVWCQIPINPEGYIINLKNQKCE